MEKSEAAGAVIGGMFGDIGCDNRNGCDSRRMAGAVAPVVAVIGGGIGVLSR